MKVPFITLLVISMFLSGVQTSCRHLKPVAKNDSKILEASSDSILFLSIKIQLTDGIEKVELIESRTRAGKLKIDMGMHAEPIEGFLLCSFLNDEEQVIKETCIEHPLYRSVEFFDPDGTPHREELALTEAVFHLRTMIDPKVVYLRVGKVTPGKNIERISIIVL